MRVVFVAWWDQVWPPAVPAVAVAVNVAWIALLATGWSGCCSRNAVGFGHPHAALAARL